MAEQDKTPPEEDALDTFFAAARARAAPVPEDLFARIMADAAAAQQGAGPEPRPVSGGPTLIARLLASLGGWPSVAGLATATLAGVWIGTAQPVVLDDLGIALASVADSSDAYDLADLMPDYDILSEDG